MVPISSLGVEEYLKELSNQLEKAKNDVQLFKAIVNAPFSDKHRTATLGLGIVVLLLVNKKEKTIDRVALSDTDLAKGAVNMSVKPFEDIKIPLGHRGNIIALTIATGQYQLTTDWPNLFAPALSSQEARLNQAGAGIACSFVYPLASAKGALIFSYFVPLAQVKPEHNEFMFRYSKLVSKSLRALGR